MVYVQHEWLKGGSGGERPSEEVVYGQHEWLKGGLGVNAPVRWCCIDSRGC